MKSTKDKIYMILSAVYVVLTGGINAFGYFHLPDEIATQFSLRGEQVNHMPKAIYLSISFALVLMLSLFCTTKGQQKLKFLLVNTILVIANIIMIAMQL